MPRREPEAIMRNSRAMPIRKSFVPEELQTTSESHGFEITDGLTLGKNQGLQHIGTGLVVRSD